MGNQSNVQVAETLAVVLSDCKIMTAAAQGFHWNVKGMDFHEFHSFFAMIYEDIDGSIDAIAENIRKVGFDSPYMLEQFIELSSIEEQGTTDDPLSMARALMEMNSITIDSLNRAFGAANDANQQGIADFIAGRIDMHQKWQWQLTATLTNPNSQSGVPSYMGKAEAKRPLEATYSVVDVWPTKNSFATNGDSCPPATQDIALNLKNRKNAIDTAMYGPLNPAEPNEEYWQTLADEWSVDVESAKQQRCGNCAVFNISPSMKDCIQSGLTGDSDTFDAIDEAGELGYCEAFDFKCASARTCRAWVGGGPITAAGKKRTISQTPAPKKDRIKGSKKNPKGSASGKGKIKFDEKTEASLRNKVEEHNKKAPKGRKTSISTLKAVYRRGAGAYSVSHRPGMTRNQWAMGRVNAFLTLLKSGKPSNPAYTTDNDLLPASHPRSSKKKASALTASGLIPEEQALAEALLAVTEKYGKFDQDGDGVWAGYTPAHENEDVKIGVACMNCVFYTHDENGKDVCKIISLDIEDLGKCRFAVLPEGVVKGYDIPLRDSQDLELLLASYYADQELDVELKSQEEYESPEHAILAMTEFSGLGYDAEPAFRAAWLRAVRDGENAFDRASSLAIATYASKDADLLPIDEKGI